MLLHNKPFFVNAIGVFNSFGEQTASYTTLN